MHQLQFHNIQPQFDYNKKKQKFDIKIETHNCTNKDVTIFYLYVEKNVFMAFSWKYIKWWVEGVMMILIWSFFTHWFYVTQLDYSKYVIDQLTFKTISHSLYHNMLASVITSVIVITFFQVQFSSPCF